MEERVIMLPLKNDKEGIHAKMELSECLTKFEMFVFLLPVLDCLA